MTLTCHPIASSSSSSSSSTVSPTQIWLSQILSYSNFLLHMHWPRKIKFQFFYIISVLLMQYQINLVDFVKSLLHGLLVFGFSLSQPFRPHHYHHPDSLLQNPPQSLHICSIPSVFIREMHIRNHCFGAMNCFHFSNGDDEDEAKSTERTASVVSVTSTFHDPDMKVLESASSQTVSDSSSESSSAKVISLTNLAERPNNLKEFTVAELRTATKNFSRSGMLGEGGFGSVYKGVVHSTEEPEKRIDIAVKQLSKRGTQGHKEWVTEVNVLGVVQHPNLVKLVGYCAEDDERGIQRLLVYEYMSNGSVLDHLSSRSYSKTPLSWTTRLKIAQDTARGLAYLHEGLDFQIIFRDFKSSNILIDDHWNAKLADFGLARLGPSDGLSHVSTAVVGTIGYAAPEYINTGRLTSKSDVWSYGIFLYELITGRRPFDRNRPKGEQKLLEWVRPHLMDLKKFKDIIDPRLEEEQYCLKSVQKVAAVANRCLCRNPKRRPRMSEVLKILESIVDESEKEIPNE